jgi:hypothetical protein
VGAERAIEKLRNIMGEKAADLVVRETMQIASISNLDDPNQLLKFADALMKQGGVLVAIGNAIKIQAILEGATTARSHPRLVLDLKGGGRQGSGGQ